MLSFKHASKSILEWFPESKFRHYHTCRHQKGTSGKIFSGIKI
jgi:hypothetical protein